jgi:hypothetical protein
MREQHWAGVHYLEVATALMHRVRSVHPTKGLYEAADLHWWWSTRAQPTISVSSSGSITSVAQKLQ